MEATLYELDSDGGYLAGVLEIDKASNILRAFLK